MGTTHQVINVEKLRKAFTLKQKDAGLKASIKSLWSSKYIEKVAVDEVSFSINQGEIVAFIGPNGAGKSTTIKMLTGLLTATSGSISVLGMDPTKERSKLCFKLGAVFGQRSQLWMHLPALDSFDLLAKIYELDWSEYLNRRARLVEMCQIGDLLKSPVRKLSLGERMRCEIVASLLHKPSILLLDEPTIGLDVIAKAQVREVILQLNRDEQVTVFLTSHDAGDIESLARRTIVINHGRVIFDGSTEQFRSTHQSARVVEVFSYESFDSFAPEVGQVLSRSAHALRIEVSSASDVKKLLGSVMASHDLSDVKISSPDMEEIIAHMYNQKGASSA